MTSRINTSDDIGRRIAKNVLHKFFTTQPYPYTKHHIDSYDQFLSTDLAAIFRSKNPIRNVKNYIEGETNKYVYNVEIYVGGINGDDIEIGTPIVNLDQSNDVRIMFPNEARLRNLTYASEVKVGITVNITYNEVNADKTITPHTQTIEFKGIRLFKIPIMLHSRYCQLHNKPREFLTEAGECPYDYGGYFIIDGSEKILIGRQEQAFNTLYVTKQDKDEKISVYANVTSLSPETRKIEFVSFSILRKNNVIYVTLPMVRAPINVFVLFRALGIQSDEAIVKMIFPDLDAADAKFMADKLVPTIINAYPFTTTTLAIQYIKTLTKGFSVATVLDILRNRLFNHVLDKPGARATYLAECVRHILKVNYGFENSTNRDDVRNSRCLTSGFLIQDLFSNSYKGWIKAIRLAIDEEYNYHTTLYSGTSFANIFSEGNRNRIFKEGFISDLLLKGFKGKWGSGLGEDKTGVLQALSRLSYIDFMSHCRRVVLDFDTSQKLVGPRQLNTSQYGYFCTNETPSGASIGITKNLTVLATISTGMQPGPLIDWLMTRGGVLTCEEVTADQKAFFVPVSINNGIIGYTSTPLVLLKVLKAFKHTGFLPPFIGIGFSYNQRRLFIYTDEGRPLRPLIMIDADHQIPVEKIASLKTWRQLLMGTHPARVGTDASTSLFEDPFKGREGKPTAEDYLRELEPHKGVIEYIDPYEHNEILVANYPEHIDAETTHVEIHPSTILSAITTLIPFANHNQSPRNQLGDSQSKQSISIYASNWQNRYDNSGHISCYGDGPLARTIYYDYLGEGKLPYGNNVILAIATHGGYNRDDGFVINKSSLERGLFRTVAYRSYEFFEEDDETTGMKKRIGNPANIGSWLDLRPGLNYQKLDERGIVKVGEYVDEDTVIVGGYYQLEKGKYKDASMTPKVWTRGTVESVIVTVNNKGLRLVKVRVVQDRVPELGDKKSNRHGQKGTIGAIIPSVDLPRTKDGIVPDIISNPLAIPSRMTMAMILESLLGKAAACHGAIGDATTFMNDGNPAESIGKVLESQYGFEKYGNEILYDGITGRQLKVAIFIGPTYYMRLKHMVEDKWQARTTGRREAKTHQPTGGRGNEGGIRFGELERDTVVTHGAIGFLRETLMKRSDGVEMPICTGCGTVPIYNKKLNVAVCPMCQGPIKYAGNSSDTLEMIPPNKKQIAPIIQVEMPYCMKVLEQEMATYGNMSMRFVPTSGFQKITNKNLLIVPDANQGGTTILPEFKLPEIDVPELMNPESSDLSAEKPVPNMQDLASLAKSVGMTLVPENSAMTRDLTGTGPLGIEEADSPAAKEARAAANEKIVEGSLNEEEALVAPDDEQEVQILPGAIPPTPALKVFGSKAPAAQSPRVVEPMPMMSPEQMASVLVNTAIQQPQVFAAAANQANQAMMPSGPTVIVDTSPRAMAAEGLMPAPSERPIDTGLRITRRKQPAAPARPEPEVSMANSRVTVNKMG